MQRLFTMFPAGMPGVALILLRIGVAGSLWVPSLEGGPPGIMRLLCLGTVTVLLMVGFATPLIGILAVAVQLARIIVLLRLGLSSPTDIVTAAIHVTSALSLALLGAGAFSIDARLFGRRILTSS